MILWNALFPEIFGLGKIGFLQAVGLMVLSRLIFGGFGSHLMVHMLHDRYGGREKFSGWSNKFKKFYCMDFNERREMLRKSHDHFHKQAENQENNTVNEENKDAKDGSQ
jgi:hypothetical protein